MSELKSLKQLQVFTNVGFSTDLHGKNFMATCDETMTEDTAALQLSVKGGVDNSVLTNLAKMFKDVVVTPLTNFENLSIYTYERLVKTTAVTVVLYAFDLLDDNNDKTSRELVKFNFPTSLTGKVFKSIREGDYSISQTPNSIKNLESSTVPVRFANIEGFNDTFNRFFHNPYFYCMNDDIVYGHEEQVLLETVNEDYCKFLFEETTYSDFELLNKKFKEFQEQTTKGFERIKSLLGSLGIQPKEGVEVTDVKGVYNADNYEIFTRDHDLHFSYVVGSEYDLHTQDKVLQGFESLHASLCEVSTIPLRTRLTEMMVGEARYAPLVPALYKVPFDAGKDKETIEVRAMDVFMFDDERDKERRYETLAEVYLVLDDLNVRLAEMLFDYRMNRILVKQVIMFIATLRREVANVDFEVYKFNDADKTDTLLALLNEELHDMSTADNALGLDLASWDLYDYANNPEGEYVEFDFKQRLNDTYTDSFIDAFYQTALNSGSPYFKPHGTPVKVEAGKEDEFPIGHVRYENGEEFA